MTYDEWWEKNARDFGSHRHAARVGWRSGAEAERERIRLAISEVWDSSIAESNPASMYDAVMAAISPPD